MIKALNVWAFDGGAVKAASLFLILFTVIILFTKIQLFFIRFSLNTPQFYSGVLHSYNIHSGVIQDIKNNILLFIANTIPLNYTVYWITLYGS
jgi:hypothetical protein